MAKGSLGHIRRYVNDPFLREVLNNLIFTAAPTLARQASGPISWVSPLQKDGYKEYSDGGFLKACGLENQTARLRKFWPSGGPCWDALATVARGSDPRGIILVEAKAHLSELKEKDSTRATDKNSLKLIDEGLQEMRKFFDASNEGVAWHKAYYQVCNRLAQLYFLNVELKVPTWLVWLFIVDAPEWRDGVSPNQWASRFDSFLSAIGLPSRYPLQDRIVVAYAPSAPVALGLPATEPT